MSDVSRPLSRYGKPLPTTLPDAHARILALEDQLTVVLRMLRAHTMQLGASGNPKTRERIERAQEILQQESLEP